MNFISMAELDTMTFKRTPEDHWCELIDKIHFQLHEMDCDHPLLLRLVNEHFYQAKRLVAELGGRRNDVGYIETPPVTNATFTGMADQLAAIPASGALQRQLVRIESALRKLAKTF